MKKSIKILLSISLWFAVIIPLFLSTSCSPVEKEIVLDDLLPNLWVFLSHVFATVVLLLVSIYLVWKPTKTSLAKRHEYIQNEISQTEEIKKNALKQLAEAEQTKINAFNDAKKIIETANSQLKDIEIIEENDGLMLLDEKVTEALKYRKKYPEASLKELAEIISLETNKSITKSGLNHRLKKISDLADSFRKMKKES